MNLLHLADLHLGKRVNGFDLLPDQRYILEQVLDLCTAHNVQAVALAGDIYDTALPPAAAVLLLDWFLTELAHRNIPVLAIAGNHDSAERLDYAAGLLSNQQVYLAGQFTSAPRRVILQDEFGELTFDLLPFVRPATVRHCLPDADIRDEDSAIAAALGPLPTAGERRVLIAHQMVLGGGSLPTCSGSESRCQRRHGSGRGCRPLYRLPVHRPWPHSPPAAGRLPHCAVRGQPAVLFAG